MRVSNDAFRRTETGVLRQLLHAALPAEFGAVLNLTQLINYPVAATSPAGPVCSQGFQEGQESPRRSSDLGSARPASAARVQTTYPRHSGAARGPRCSKRLIKNAVRTARPPSPARNGPRELIDPHISVRGGHGDDATGQGSRPNVPAVHPRTLWERPRELPPQRWQQASRPRPRP